MALDWQRQKNQFTTLLSSEIVRLWFSLCCLYPMCYMCLFWVLDLFTRHWDTIKVNGYILLVHACGTLWETKSHGTVRLASGIISVRCSLLNTPQVVGTLSTIEVVPLLVIYALTVNIYIYIYIHLQFQSDSCTWIYRWKSANYNSEQFALWKHD